MLRRTKKMFPGNLPGAVCSELPRLLQPQHQEALPVLNIKGQNYVNLIRNCVNITTGGGPTFRA